MILSGVDQKTRTWSRPYVPGRSSLTECRETIKAGVTRIWRRHEWMGRPEIAEFFDLETMGAKEVLIRAAEQGYITEIACKMPRCFCPEELGGTTYFEPVTPGLSDWMPTHEHYPRPKRDGGRLEVDNAILAHRLCNRLDFSIPPLERISHSEPSHRASTYFPFGDGSNSRPKLPPAPSWRGSSEQAPRQWVSCAAGAFPDGSTAKTSGWPVQSLRYRMRVAAAA